MESKGSEETTLTIDTPVHVALSTKTPRIYEERSTEAEADDEGEAGVPVVPAAKRSEDDSLFCSGSIRGKPQLV